MRTGSGNGAGMRPLGGSVGCVASTMSFFILIIIVCRFGHVIRRLQKLGGCSSLGGFLHGLVGLLAQYGNLLLLTVFCQESDCRGLHRFCCSFEVALHGHDSLHDCA